MPQAMQAIFLRDDVAGPLAVAWVLELMFNISNKRNAPFWLGH